MKLKNTDQMQCRRTRVKLVCADFGGDAKVLDVRSYLKNFVVASAEKSLKKLDSWFNGY